MFDKTKVREGAVVYSADGEKIGKVRSCEAEIFVIEKGLFFPKDTIARYADIAEASDDGIRMALGKEALTSTSGEVDEGEHAEPQRKPGLKERIEEKLTGRGGEARASGDEVRMPIAEEQLDVSKRDRQAGEVRLRKEVETERQTVDVPVMKERVHVERVPADRSSAPDAGFQPTTTSMPVHEEEVEIRKRPVVKEEVRLRREREIEHRAADADVRKEHASIEREGAAERLDKDPGDDER